MVGLFARTILVVVACGTFLYLNWGWTLPQVIMNAAAIVFAIICLWYLFSLYNEEV